MSELSSLSFNQYPWFALFVPLLIWFIKTPKTQSILPSLLNPISVFYPLLSVLPTSEEEHYAKPKITLNKTLFSVLVSCIIISLAQPVIKSPIQKKLALAQAVDLILVVNSSISMVLKDYKEGDAQLSRMQKAQHILQQLVQQFKGERIGLVVLGNPSAIWLPLTSDKNQVSFAINNIKPTLAGRTSDVGAALNLIKQSYSQQSHNKKVILLVDDAYLQLGSTPPIKKVHELNQAGFVLHTLAIGSSQKPKFSLGVGHLIYAPADLTLLTELAHAGEGKMIRAWNNQTVDELLSVLKTSQLVEPPLSSKTKQVALFQYPLVIALILLLFNLFPVHSLLLRFKHVD